MLLHQRSKILTFIILLLSNLIVIWTCILFYTYNPYYNNFISDYPKQAILILAFFYSFVSIYSSITAVNRNSDTRGLILLRSVSKAFQNQYLFFKDPLFKTKEIKIQFTEIERKTLLFSLVKIIYIPIMFNFLFNNLSSLRATFSDSMASFGTLAFIDFFNLNLFQLVLSIIFLIDTAYFCFGYIFEANFLNNKIKSVDNTFTGWLFALSCYPPYSSVTSYYAPWSSDEYISFSDNYITLICRILIIILLSIYLYASISLGTKCSNLTNRGIVKIGAYKFVRHPAYISKNAVWWLTLAPVLKDNNFAFLSMIVWSFIYFMRAITEEKHLLNDKEYQEYCVQVKYRFIPGVF